MKVKDFINGQFQGRHNNLIFYTRGNNTYVRRYAIPGKKRKWETEGRTPKQQAVAIRFKAVQVFYMTFAKQVSPEICTTCICGLASSKCMTAFAILNSGSSFCRHSRI